MKKNARQLAKPHHSEVLDEFLSLGTPEELDHTESRMMLAAKIQDAMTAKGIGKKQLAEMMGQRPSVITKWLSGGHNFTSDTLTDIQRVLGVRLLALDEKPIVSNVYRISLKLEVTAVQLHEILHSIGQQSFSLPPARTDKAFTTKKNIRRNFAYA